MGGLDHCAMIAPARLHNRPPSPHPFPTRGKGRRKPLVNIQLNCNRVKRSVPAEFRDALGQERFHAHFKVIRAPSLKLHVSFKL